MCCCLRIILILHWTPLFNDLEVEWKHAMGEAETMKCLSSKRSAKANGFQMKAPDKWIIIWRFWLRHTQVFEELLFEYVGVSVRWSVNKFIEQIAWPICLSSKAADGQILKLAYNSVHSISRSDVPHTLAGLKQMHTCLTRIKQTFSEREGP